MDVPAFFAAHRTRLEGLSDDEALERLAEHGPNTLAKDQQAGLITLLRHAFINPLVILLATLAGVSFATGDLRAGAMMVLMIVMGAGLKLFQEAKADRAAAKLKAMISVNATVLRGGRPMEIAVSRLVPGDAWIAVGQSFGLASKAGLSLLWLYVMGAAASQCGGVLLGVGAILTAPILPRLLVAAFVSLTTDLGIRPARKGVAG